MSTDEYKKQKAEYDKNYREINKEKRKENKRQHYFNNREHYFNNREHYLHKSELYRKENAPKIKEYKKEYGKTHKKEKAEYDKKRKSRLCYDTILKEICSFGTFSSRVYNHKELYKNIIPSQWVLHFTPITQQIPLILTKSLYMIANKIS